jgi:hypothetical protein
MLSGKDRHTSAAHISAEVAELSRFDTPEQKYDESRFPGKT